MERGNGGRRLLVWDAPNMDMCLSEVIGERATAATRPNLGAVLGYREKDAFASRSAALAFVDVEDVPGAFERPLPRTNLFDLPPSGRWFEPFATAPEPIPQVADLARPHGTVARGAVLHEIE